MQAIIDAIEHGLAVIRGVISNRADAYGLEGAKNIIFPQRLFLIETFLSVAVLSRLSERLLINQPELIVLTGFMRKLSGDFVNYYEGRMVSISIQPSFPNTPALIPMHACSWQVIANTASVFIT